MYDFSLDFCAVMWYNNKGESQIVRIAQTIQIFKTFTTTDPILNFQNFRNCQNLLTTQASNSHVCQIPGAAKELSSCGRCQILKELRRSCAQPLSYAEELRRRSYNVEEGRSNATGPYIIFPLYYTTNLKIFQLSSAVSPSSAATHNL